LNGPNNKENNLEPKYSKNNLFNSTIRMHLKIFKFIYITLRMQEINLAELFSRGHPVYTETGNMENVKNVFMQTPFIMST
jgi:hypothetical protein